MTVSRTKTLQWTKTVQLADGGSPKVMLRKRKKVQKDEENISEEPTSEEVAKKEPMTGITYAVSYLKHSKVKKKFTPDKITNLEPVPVMRSLGFVPMKRSTQKLLIKNILAE